MGIKVPEKARSEMAMAGDWAVVSNQAATEEREKPLSVGVKKRKLEGQEEEEEAGEGVVARRAWGTTTKRFPRHDNSDLDDLLSGSISVVKKERPITPTPVLPENEVEESELNKLEGQFTSTDQGSASVNLEDMEPRKVVKGEDDTFVKEEPGGAQARATVDKIPEASPMPVFKRRKAKAS